MESTVLNPAGTINVTEYSMAPQMYGTCTGTSETLKAIYNSESMVSQRINDILFHKGNSQSVFSTPGPVDTLPDNQEAFARYCYGSDKFNPKYASVFMNEPDKLRKVLESAKPTGTENGG